ncbi:hypothetical protein [Streptomyces sp. BF23-19]|uniref:hypothetical protein n=1 Tax=unclassified Streptomyces TaxID=2593676 RepID=UPI0034E5E36C
MKKILAATALALAGIALAGPAHADEGDTVTSVAPSPSKEVLKTSLDAAGGVEGGVR